MQIRQSKNFLQPLYYQSYCTFIFINDSQEETLLLSASQMVCYAFLLHGRDLLKIKVIDAKYHKPQYKEQSSMFLNDLLLLVHLMVPRGARQVNGTPYGERCAVRVRLYEVYRNILFAQNILLYFLYWAQSPMIAIVFELILYTNQSVT